MITRQAPGKLFIAGEYAVVEPGYPAVVVAVDRCVTVTVTTADPAQGVVVHSDLHGGLALRCVRAAHRVVAAGAGTSGEFAPVLAAATVVEQLAAERGHSATPFRLAVTGRPLFACDGRKFGLGSSSAVTVATIAALSAHYGLDLSTMDRYRLAMLATLATNPNASGGDVAASTWGGWLAYHAPDRAQVSALVTHHGVDGALRTDWPRLRVRRLRAPSSLQLYVGWTGEPASTPAMVARSRGTDWRNSDCYNDFLTASAGSVLRLIDALDADDAAGVLREIRRCRRILTELDDATALGIMTPRLETLCAAAESVGAAAKPSGAGGGDCGIALLRADASRASVDLIDLWTRAGIRPLPLHVHTAEEALR
ncbi:phosphomevalonate kinase [Nocardia sp. JMUB6875]|uniref:phosphomevalonate kinase n=1 Tax=Nocardia sp. JMUB6875 TaxID=3158170 RepID=UPI0032E659A4